MKHYEGSLTITAENARDFADLKTVSGALDVLAPCRLPALTSVGGWLSVYADCHLPALTSVGGGLYVRADCHAPLLGTLLCVSGYGLFRTVEGTYHAGCRQGLTADQALAHWGSRDDARAILFTAAVKKAEGVTQ
jgi:hypothetical protein